MKTKILFIAFMAIAIAINAQNTIPTTTVAGALSVNDSLKVTRDITANGDITSNGEVISRDTMRAQKDVIVDGNATIGGKLKVEGNAKFKDDVRLNKGFTFDGNKGISFTPATASSPAKIHYGNKVMGIPERCAAAPQAWANHLFGGMVQIYNVDQAGDYIPGHGLLNFQTWAGGSSIDASIGGTSLQTGSLLLNYFCGNNTFINTGGYGGKVSMGKNVEIGIPSENLNIALNINVQNGLSKALSVFGAGLNKEIFQIKSNGATYIGAEKVGAGPHTDAMLTVSGKVACKEVRVFNNASGYWADFVFEKNYKLMPLSEVESYYKNNKHLPNIPTAKQIEENGNDLSRTDALLLQKIEELTLYIVQQQKEIDALKKEIKK